MDTDTGEEKHKLLSAAEMQGNIYEMQMKLLNEQMELVQCQKEES